MLSYQELSKSELATLTEEPIAFLIDAACAEQGIPLMPPVPTPLSIEPVRGDMDVYGIDSLLFTDREKAEAVLAILRECTLLRHEYAPGYEDRIVQVRESVPTLTMHRCFSQAKWNEVRGEYERIRLQREAYRTVQKEYDEIGSQRQAVAEDVLGAIAEAKAWKARRDVLEASIEQYQKLAGENPELAFRYFIKAYPNVMEEYPDLIREYFPLEVAA